MNETLEHIFKDLNMFEKAIVTNVRCQNKINTQMALVFFMLAVIQLKHELDIKKIRREILELKICQKVNFKVEEEYD